MSLEGKSPEDIAALAALADELSTNPKTRQHFMGLVKTHNPSVHIPEIDIPNQVNSMMKQGLERLEKSERELAAMKAEKAIQQNRSALLKNKKLGLSEDDIPEIEKLMLEKQIPSHETAAEFYSMQKKSAVPTPANAAAQNFKESTMPKMDLNPFKGNINDWARNAAKAALDEVRSGQIKV